MRASASTLPEIHHFGRVVCLANNDAGVVLRDNLMGEMDCLRHRVASNVVLPNVNGRRGVAHDQLCAYGRNAPFQIGTNPQTPELIWLTMYKVPLGYYLILMAVHISRIRLPQVIK